MVMPQQDKGAPSGGRYALITSAWNEEAYIEAPLNAVTAQTVAPQVWIIVSDASSDRTDEIVRAYSEHYDFIRLYRLPQGHQRSFAACIDAINSGYEQIRGLCFDFVGNLDADISVEPDYFERLLRQFESDPRLGLAGGVICEKKGGTFRERRLNRPHSVGLAVQFFRRECFDALGGYTRLCYGSSDWHAEVSMRMRGWDVRSIAGLRAYHHRPTGTAGSPLSYGYRQGLADYSLGTHPLFEIAKVVRRLPDSPFGTTALAELMGFVQACLKHKDREASQEFIEFLRKEQLHRIFMRTQLYQ